MMLADVAGLGRCYWQMLAGAQIEQLRLNPNGIAAIEALFAQLRGFVSHFRARDAADSTSSGNSGTTRPGARVCAALRSCDVMPMMMRDLMYMMVHDSHVSLLICCLGRNRWRDAPIEGIEAQSTRHTGELARCWPDAG
jgi:hypothetical protein